MEKKHRRIKMLKVIKVLKVIVKVLYNVFIIASLTLLIVNGFRQEFMITYGQRSLQLQIDSLNDSNNNLLDNDITLEKDVQEALREVTKTITGVYEDMTKVVKITREGLEAIQKQTAEPDVNKLLNGEVFVQDIMGAGAGTVIKKTNKEMYILTCAHVVQDIHMLQEKGLPIAGTLGYSKTGEKDKISGMVLYAYTVVKYDEENDLALIKTTSVDEKLNVIPLATEIPNKGDTVYSVGDPLGLYRTLSKGILCNKTEGFYVSDNTTTYGNSGGGLFNKNGELISVPSQVYVYGEGDTGYAPESSLGFSISLERIREFLGDFLKE
jgi:S1-C subfamily serine protease